MRQDSLFDDEPDRGRLVPVGVRGSASALSKAQKQFNKWLAKIEAQRKEIDEWLAYGPIHVARCARELEPLNARMLEARVALVRLLDGALERNGLTKRQRATAQDVLLEELSLVLDESSDDELEQLYAKYSDVSFAEQQEEERGMLRQILNDEFGLDIDEDEADPQAWAQRITEKAQADAAADAASGRKKTKKAIEQERIREEARRMAQQSVREIYRKLVSELHPDREPDPKERSRKTLLMQDVNKAYEANDLLALLQLQLAIEQIDHADLAALGDDRLEHFNQVLREQSQGLDQELQILTAPYLMGTGGLAFKLTPRMVQEAFSADISDLAHEVSQREAELRLFEDLRELKKFLNDMRGSVSDEEMFLAFSAVLDDVVNSPSPSPGKRRKR